MSTIVLLDTSIYLNVLDVEGWNQDRDEVITVPATGHRRVDKRSAVHQRWRGIRWTALALVHPTAGTMIKAGPAISLMRMCRRSSEAVRFSLQVRVC